MANMKTITVREACRRLDGFPPLVVILNRDEANRIARLLRAQQRRIKELEREVALLANDAGSTRVSNFGNKKLNAAKPQE
jgi:hypothetical protein